jgi:hypothetical protein
MEVSGHFHVLAVLPSENCLRYPLDKSLGGSQSRSGRCGEEKILASARNRTRALKPVPIPTEPAELLFWCCVEETLRCNYKRLTMYVTGLVNFCTLFLSHYLLGLI